MYLSCFRNTHGHSVDGEKDFRWQKPTSEVFYLIDSPVLQRAVKGRILVLDTMLDYAQIQKAFESGEWIAFFKKLRRLINVCGCVAIIMLVHPTKTGAGQTRSTHRNTRKTR